MLFCLNFVQEKCCFEHFFRKLDCVTVPTYKINKNKGHIQANEDITRSDKSHFIKKIQHRHAEGEIFSLLCISSVLKLCCVTCCATSVFHDS